MVSLLAWGMSTATKATPLSIRFEMKATERARRSSLAITKHPAELAPAQGERGGELGPVIFPAALHLHELGLQLPQAPHIGRHGGFLGIEAKAALPLSFGGNAVVGDEGKLVSHGRVFYSVTDVSDHNTLHRQASTYKLSLGTLHFAL